MRVLCSLMLVLGLVAPAAARAEQLSPSGGAKSTLIGGERGFLAVWGQRTATGSDVVARPLDGIGRPTGPARVIGYTRRGFGQVMPPSGVWNPRRREFMVAFQASTAQEASIPCVPTGVPYALPCLDENDVEIFTRRVGPAGRPRGPIRRATATGDPRSGIMRSERPSLALDVRGRDYLLAFTATTAPALRELRVQRLRPDGRRAGGSRRIGPAPVWGGITSGVAGSLGRGGWGVLVDSLPFVNGAPTGADLRLQRLSARARPLGRLRRVGPEQSEQMVATALSLHPRTGYALAVWRRESWSDRAHLIRLLGAGGRTLGPVREFPFSRSWDQVSVVPFRSGWAMLVRRFVPGGDHDIFLGRLNAEGGMEDELVRLTTFAREVGSTSGPNDDRFVFDPVIAADGRGRLVGLWTEEPEGGPGQEIHVRRLN